MMAPIGALGQHFVESPWTEDVHDAIRLNEEPIMEYFGSNVVMLSR